MDFCLELGTFLRIRSKMWRREGWGGGQGNRRFWSGIFSTLALSKLCFFVMTQSLLRNTAKLDAQPYSAYFCVNLVLSTELTM